MSEQAVPSQTGVDDQLQSSADFTGSDWKATLRRTAKEFKTDRATLISAGMAFYWFLAVFPALIAAVGIFGLVNAGKEATDSLMEAIRTTLPGDAAKVLAEAVDNAPSGGASLVAAVVGLVLALFSASAGMVALQNGLDVAYDVPQEHERKYVKKRLRGLLLMVVAGVLGGVATVFTVFGQPLGESFSDSLPFGGGVSWPCGRWCAGSWPSVPSPCCSPPSTTWDPAVTHRAGAGSAPAAWWPPSSGCFPRSGSPSTCRAWARTPRTTGPSQGWWCSCCGCT
ncbi:MAG: YihY/virulence factor BrkB family protein [Actinobacteria bacterium]|nr:YihY/virulence factor BrkB family protein [Actinomycetota bacterium]